MSYCAYVYEQRECALPYPSQLKPYYVHRMGHLSPRPKEQGPILMLACCSVVEKTLSHRAVMPVLISGGTSRPGQPPTRGESLAPSPLQGYRLS